MPLISSTEVLVRNIKTKINPSKGIETKNIHCHFIPTSLILLTVRGKATQTVPNKIIAGITNTKFIIVDNIPKKSLSLEIEK